MTKPNKLIKELRNARIEAGIDPKPVYKHLGVSSGHFSNMELGRRPMPLKHFLKYVELLPEARLWDLKHLIFGDG